MMSKSTHEGDKNHLFVGMRLEAFCLADEILNCRKIVLFSSSGKFALAYKRTMIVDYIKKIITRVLEQFTIEEEVMDVFYCSILTMKTLNDVCREEILT